MPRGEVICADCGQYEGECKCGKPQIEPWDREQTIFEDGKKAGRNEVIDWINSRCIITTPKIGEEWRTKQKDWGIK